MRSLISQYLVKSLESMAESFGIDDLGFMASSLTAILVVALLVPMYKLVREEIMRFRNQKQQDIELALRLLDGDFLSEDDRYGVLEILQRKLFRRFYKINAGINMRTALLGFYTRHQDSIGWHDLQRGYPFIDFYESGLRVQLSWRNRIGYWLVNLFSGLVFLYAACVAALAFYMLVAEGNTNSFLLFIITAFLVLCAMIFSTINWPYQSAKKIQSCLQEDRERAMLEENQIAVLEPEDSTATNELAGETR